MFCALVAKVAEFAIAVVPADCIVRTFKRAKLFRGEKGGYAYAGHGNDGHQDVKDAVRRKKDIPSGMPFLM